MYMYDETAGKKGSNECVSLLKYYIDNYISEEGQRPENLWYDIHLGLFSPVWKYWMEYVLKEM